MKRFTAVPDVRLQTFSWAKEKKIEEDEANRHKRRLFDSSSFEQAGKKRKKELYFVCLRS